MGHFSVALWVKGWRRESTEGVPSAAWSRIPLWLGFALTQLPDILMGTLFGPVLDLERGRLDVTRPGFTKLVRQMKRMAGRE